MAVGSNSTANGAQSLVGGDGCTSGGKGYGSIVFGSDCYAGEGTNRGNYGIVVGAQCKSNGNACQAFGYLTEAKGSFSHAEGSGSKANGTSSHAEGNYTQCQSSNSHSEGDTSLASGYTSHAEGGYTEAGGQYSHAEGYETVTRGTGGHAEGVGSVAGSASHAQGLGNIAIGNGKTFSITEQVSKTTSSSTNKTTYVFKVSARDSDIFDGDYDGFIVSVSASDTYPQFAVLSLSSKNKTELTITAISENIKITTADTINPSMRAIAFKKSLLTPCHSNGAFNMSLGEGSFTSGKYNEATGDFSFAGGTETIANEGSMVYGEGLYDKDAGHTTMFGTFTTAKDNSAFCVGIGTKSQNVDTSEWTIVEKMGLNLTNEGVLEVEKYISCMDGVAPTNGQVLSYNGTTQKMEWLTPQTTQDGGGASSGGGITTTTLWTGIASEGAGIEFPSSISQYSMINVVVGGLYSTGTYVKTTLSIPVCALDLVDGDSSFQVSCKKSATAEFSLNLYFMDDLSLMVGEAYKSSDFTDVQVLKIVGIK